MTKKKLPREIRVRQIEAFGEERYWVSEDGQVFVTMAPAITSKGYVRYSIKKSLSRGKISKNPFAHRLVALAFIPNPDEKATVNHIDGDKLNNHVSNLEWATPAEQVIHAMSIGLRPKSPRGIDHVNAKFTAEQVRSIRARVAGGEARAKIVAEFGVAEDAIQRMTGNGKIRSYRDVV